MAVGRSPQKVARRPKFLKFASQFLARLKQRLELLLFSIVQERVFLLLLRLHVTIELLHRSFGLFRSPFA